MFSFITVYECGQNVDAQSGTLSSPDYPNNYIDFRTCYYLIRVPNAQKIEFSINDFMTEVDKDFFEYGQGGTANVNTAIAQFSGDIGVTNGNPSVFEVQGDQAWIIFSSDRNNPDRGWTLSYRAGK